jgi:predicted metal-dependent hydrolase
MSLSPEQFKEILQETIREEISDLVTKKDFNILQTSVDKLTKEYKNSEVEKFSNQEAHKRLENGLNEIRQKVGIKTVPLV